MRSTRYLVRAALLALLFVVPARPAAHGQPSDVLALAPAQARYAGAIRRSEALIDSLMQAQRIPGLTAAVAVDGEIVWADGFGWADLENRVPAWPHTKMRIGSVSKALTSIALAQLVEAGRLDLDAAVQAYVPAFPKKRYPVTVRQLAGHLAGIRHYEGDEFLSTTSYPSVEAGLEMFAADTLLFEPGTKYAYSSYGWNLLSAVVEGASGEDFLGYMRAHVLGPLGLRHTVADHPDSLILHRTRFYARDPLTGRIENAPYVDNSYKWAGGGYLSTAEDLVRFGSALVTADVLRPETRKLLFTSQKTSDGKATGYGIGWFTGTDEQGRRRVGHGGGSVGGATQFIVYPEEKVVVALIANLGEVAFGDLQERIADLFMPR